MDTIRLRTLTYKSSLGFGQYADMTIRNIIDMGNTGYLRWVYFNNDMITFTDEILDEIHLYSGYKIDKPGKCPENNEKLHNLNFAMIGDENRMKLVSRMKKRRKKKQCSLSFKYKYLEKKSVLQAKNHGK